MPEIFVQGPDFALLHKGLTIKTLQQIRCVCVKKFLDTVYNVPLIINQWILPIAMALLIVLILQEQPKEVGTRHAADMSLRRVKHGRFLIFDPSNNIKRRNILENALQKYPRLKIIRYNSSYHSRLWPKKYPWAVGGAVIKSEENVPKGKSYYTWLIANYIHHKEEMLFHLISDVEFAAGQLQMRVSFSSTVIDGTSTTQTYSTLIAGAFFFFICVFLNVSFVTSPVEGRVSNFHHQQFLAGLSPLLFWITTYALDVCITAIVMILIRTVLTHFGYPIRWMLILYSCVHSISMLPFVYAVSLFVDRVGAAKFLCIIYELCSAWIILLLSENTNVTFYAFLFPGVEFLRNSMEEFFPSDIPNILWDELVLPAFLAHGVAFLLVLLAYEYHVERPVLRIIFKKTYTEKNDIPDGQDVICERDAVTEDVSKFALAVQNLTKYYGSYCAVKGITYGVRAEDCFGLVGASGAGKTSTFDIITGLRYPNDGMVYIANQFVNRSQKIGYCPQFDAMSSRLSCKQNLTIIAGLMGYKKPQLVAGKMLDFLNVSEHRDKAFGYCSGGQRRRINIGAALLNPSKLVILDEPTAGIDPETRRYVWSLLQKMRNNGKAVLLSSHSMEECEALCSRIGVLIGGRLVAIGSSQELKSRYTDSLFLHVILKSIKDRELVRSKVLTKFKSASLVTKRIDSLSLKFKIFQEPQDRVSALYAEVQKMALHLELNDYFLLQSSLEDVMENLNEIYSKKN